MTRLFFLTGPPPRGAFLTFCWFEVLEALVWLRIGDLLRPVGVWTKEFLFLEFEPFCLTVILVIMPSSRVTFLDEKLDTEFRTLAGMASAVRRIAFLLTDLLLLLDAGAAECLPLTKFDGTPLDMRSFLDRPLLLCLVFLLLLLD